MSANISIGKHQILKARPESVRNCILLSHISLDFKTFIAMSLRKTAMFWFTENHFLFVGLFDSGNAETQTFSVSRNRDGFALVKSRTRKSGTIAPLMHGNIQNI